MHLLLPDRKVSLRRRLWLWIANRCDLLWPRWTSGRLKCFWPHRGWCPGKTCSPCLTSEALQSWSTRTSYIKVLIVSYVSYLKWFQNCNRINSCFHNWFSYFSVKGKIIQKRTVLKVANLLNDSIEMVTHQDFWNLTHQIVQPVIQP